MAEAKTVETSSLDLTDSDWSEIYYALNDEHGAKAKIDEYGPLVPELTRVDWLEICLAIREKHAKLKDGMYGNDRLARKWLADLDGILEELSDINIGVAAT